MLERGSPGVVPVPPRDGRIWSDPAQETADPDTIREAHAWRVRSGAPRSDGGDASGFAFSAYAINGRRIGRNFTSRGSAPIRGAEGLFEIGPDAVVRAGFPEPSW